VLQILTAGAGTAHRMPEEVEYLHCVQVACDSGGLRYQVLDASGDIREWLSWPPMLPPSSGWLVLNRGVNANPILLPVKKDEIVFLALAFVGTLSLNADTPLMQTLLSIFNHNQADLAQIWMGIIGSEQRLVVKISPAPGRSPHTWIGPIIPLSQRFNFQVAFHTGMSAGGILWRFNDSEPWTSFQGVSYWGSERLNWGTYWSVGQGQRGSHDTPFTSHNISLKWHLQTSSL